MQVSNPVYLLFLIAIPLFFFFSSKSYHRMRKWLVAFNNTQLRKVKNVGRIIILSVVLLLATLSLTGLSIEFERMVTQREGIDIVIGLDTSRSMLAEDTVIPDQKSFLKQEYSNRLNRGRLETLKIIDQLNGERVGLFFFAYKGVEVVDLTDDYGLCKNYLINNESTDIAFTGSNLDHALLTGRRMFITGRMMFREDSQYKVIVFISDGELEDASQMKLVVAEAREVQKSNVIVYTIGIGEEKEVFIPKRYGSGKVAWFKDGDGNALKTKMYVESLKKIADITGGKYFHAGDDGIVAGKVIEEILKKAEGVKTLKKPVIKKVYLAPLFLFSLLLTWVGWESLMLIIDLKRAKS